MSSRNLIYYLMTAARMHEVGGPLEIEGVPTRSMACPSISKVAYAIPLAQKSGASLYNL